MNHLCAGVLMLTTLASAMDKTSRAPCDLSYNTGIFHGEARPMLQSIILLRRFRERARVLSRVKRLKPNSAP